MQTFIDTHPVLFTILALPVVVTACFLVVSMLGVEIQWHRKRDDDTP
jgi:hypothetical protein